MELASTLDPQYVPGGSAPVVRVNTIPAALVGLVAQRGQSRLLSQVLSLVDPTATQPFQFAAPHASRYLSSFFPRFAMSHLMHEERCPLQRWSSWATLRDGGKARSLDASDILVVAPYNLQVRALEAAVPPGVRVGTVDRFQGQEAPVVLLSLCHSDFGGGGGGCVSGAGAGDGCAGAAVGVVAAQVSEVRA